ncbi:MFS transporter [Polyangium aurulentum]|uniref:MFS transporter n=1 Tax=Polyangium aurulentum TaxID=2567896 RepID=UPI00146E03AD|nr:MFS transporter [Polyangium aurulentum]UQA54779.1 MFS transporter [Polyangium aurulentum]
MPAATPAALSRGKAWALALVATLTMAVSYVDRQVLASVGASVTKEFALSETQWGSLVSAFSMAYLVGSPFAGWLIDRIGARRGLVGAVLVWSIVAASHALMPSFGVLFAMRLALGLTESPSFPGAAQTVQRALPPADRARGFGVLFTGSSIGAMIAPLLAAPIAARWGFRSAFLGVAIVGLLWVPIWLALAWAKPAREVLDRGVASSGPRPPLLSIVTHPAVLRGVLPILASAPAIGFLLNWGAKYLDAVHHLDLDHSKKYLVLVPLFFDLGSLGFGHVASVRARGGKRGSGPDRLVFAVAAVFMLALAGVPFARTPLQAMLLAGIGGAGGAGLFALSTADMLARVPPEAVGTASSVGACAQSIAYIVASPLLGKLLDVSGGYTLPFLALAAWILPGCVAWIVWSPPPPHAREASA